MSREWQAGDVALIRVGTGEWEYGVMDMVGSWVCQHGTNRPGDVVALHVASSMTPASASSLPLAVIDPEDREQVERLTTEYVKTWLGPRETTSPESIDQMQDALREFADPTPPKPDEPQGLGAVVEDAEGNKWLRDGLGSDKIADGYWWNVTTMQTGNGGTTRAHWSGITAVRILSDGVTA